MGHVNKAEEFYKNMQTTFFKKKEFILYTKQKLHELCMKIKRYKNFKN